MAIQIFSNYVKKMANAIPPTIVAPTQNSANSYNRTPRILITVNAPASDFRQKVIISVAGQYSYDSELQPERFSTGGYYTGSKDVVFLSPFLDYGEHNLTVVAVGEDGVQSTSATRMFKIIKMLVPELIPNVTTVKATDLNYAEVYIYNLSHCYGTNPPLITPLVGGKSCIWNFQNDVSKLRQQLNVLRYYINNFDYENTNLDIPPIEWLPFGSGRPRADVVRQLYLVLENWKGRRNKYGDLLGSEYGKLSDYTYGALETTEIF
jgi:hypothetical protein